MIKVANNGNILGIIVFNMLVKDWAFLPIPILRGVFTTTRLGTIEPITNIPKIEALSELF